ncbi:hypothetical protein BDQ17DRAFT_1429190 [Cyathus striatus]|nr:hypothetical protein BDQ17DRAFT_1429190 [Cyathus striatus]
MLSNFMCSFLSKISPFAVLPSLHWGPSIANIAPFPTPLPAYLLPDPPKQLLKVKSAKNALQTHCGLSPPIGSSSRRIIRHSAKKAIKKADTLDIKGRLLMKTKWDRSVMLKGVRSTMRGPWSARIEPLAIQMDIVWPGNEGDYMPVDIFYRSYLSPAVSATTSTSAPVLGSYYTSLPSPLPPPLPLYRPGTPNLHRRLKPRTQPPSLRFPPPLTLRRRKRRSFSAATSLFSELKDSRHAPWSENADRLQTSASRSSSADVVENGSSSAVPLRSRSGSTTSPSQDKNKKLSGSIKVSPAEAGVGEHRSLSTSLSRSGPLSTTPPGSPPTDMDKVVVGIGVILVSSEGSTTPPDTPPALKAKCDKGKGKAKKGAASGEGDNGEKASDVSLAQVQGSSAARELGLRELLQRTRNSKKEPKVGSELETQRSLPTYLDDWLEEWKEKTGTQLTIAGVSLLFGGHIVPQYEREQPNAWPSPRTRLPRLIREERKSVPSSENEKILVPPMKCLPIPPKRWWLNVDGGLENEKRK